MSEIGPVRTIAGEPTIRTVPRMADANSSGDIFGGWVLSQMDIAGAIPAIARAKGRVVTIAIDAMTFHAPIYVGDHVSVYAEVAKVGRTSLSIRIETIARRVGTSEEVRVTEGTFVYVAVDENGRPRKVPAE